MEHKELLDLLNDMSLEEKIGQMIQTTEKGGIITGPKESKATEESDVSLMGSVLSITGAEKLREMQEKYIQQHPHKIPLMFMYDVINGFQTIFPIPLAQGCTFSPEMVEEAASIAAKEAAASGIHVTFSPMLDLVRDARWGRVMESTGEDPYLNSVLGRALIRGYQGKSLKDGGKVAACLKHFAAYSLPEGGRDYDNVELSERTLREDYLTAYRAAVEEGCKMAMTSFNTLNRIPSSGNRWLLREILRKEMGFDGVIISDYSATDEMVMHGFSENYRASAKLAIEAGVDIDMVAESYMHNLLELVQSGEVSMNLIDEAVLRILELKNDLGLFENPFKDASANREKELFLCEKHRRSSRKIAASSFVLLKNADILPLSKKEEERIAFIGPYVDNKTIYGSWSFPYTEEGIVTIKEGVDGKRSNIMFSQGSSLLDQDSCTRFHRYGEDSPEKIEQWMEEAVEQAKKADKVVLCVGEHSNQTGEGGSRTVLQIPKNQMELIRRIHGVNENIVTVLFTGRPLELNEVSALSKAVLVVWMPGTEGGNAIADVLFGDTPPEGKLSMSFPRSVGQVPIYYNHYTTGRPNHTGNQVGFIHGYIDESTKPLYPFGHGLTYTEFQYSDIQLSNNIMTKESVIMAEATITNIGKRTATETVQLYLRDVVGSVIRPVRMLKGFQKVKLEPKESKQVIFKIEESMLRFYNIDMEYTSEPGKFEVFIGTSSDTVNGAEFELIYNF